MSKQIVELTFNQPLAAEDVPLFLQTMVNIFTSALLQNQEQTFIRPDEHISKIMIIKHEDTYQLTMNWIK